MVIVYRTENKVNNKFYYGVHNTSEDDGYLGSGVALNRAIDKYGKDNFIRRTIKEFESEEDAYAFEALIVDELMLKNPDCYNLKEGGKGGWTHIDYESQRVCPKKKATMAKVAKRRKGKKLPESHRNRLAKHLDEVRVDNSGANNGRAKSITIDGNTYDTLIDARDATGLSLYKLRKLL